MTDSRDRLYEAMAIDLARKYNSGRKTPRQIVEEFFVEIPELKHAMQLREDHMRKERAMRGGVGDA